MGSITLSTTPPPPRSTAALNPVISPYLSVSSESLISLVLSTCLSPLDHERGTTAEPCVPLPRLPAAFQTSSSAASRSVRRTTLVVDHQPHLLEHLSRWENSLEIPSRARSIQNLSPRRAAEVQEQVDQRPSIWGGHRRPEETPPPSIKHDTSQLSVGPTRNWSSLSGKSWRADFSLIVNTYVYEASRPGTPAPKRPR